MAVYLPTGAVGNGRVLATIGASGEIMGLFWPHVDFANNAHECMPAVYLGEHRRGRFLWTWQQEFARRQYYLGDTNILITQLMLPSAGIELIITDFCPPDEDALVRRVRVENRSGRHLNALLMHYFDLRLGEVPWKQAVRYDPETATVIQYFRDIAVAVGGTRPDLWRCGKWSREDTNAKNDMYDGYLDGQPEDIGQVNFALAWRLALDPDRSRDIDIIFAFDTSRERAAQRLAQLTAIGRPELQRRTHHAEAAWLGRRRRLYVPDWMGAAYRRALLSIKLLTDHRSSAIIAAPEFDPAYEMCGGYGYCWPRDAAEAAMAMADAGYPEVQEGLAYWLARVQLPEGFWGQRYWSSGDVAASWSLRMDFLQLDQTASALVVMCRAAAASQEGAGGSGSQPGSERDWLWPAIRRGAEALMDAIEADGFHRRACDLWETYAGTFTYTQAAAIAALEACARAADARGEASLAAALSAAAERARKALMSLYLDGYFARGRMDGSIDPTVDSSILGVVAPFNVLDLHDPDQRAIAISSFRTVEDRLGQQFGEGIGIRRYEGDGYMGGPVGAVNTLWAALVAYQLAISAADEDEARQWQQRAEKYVRVAVAHTTPTGLLPELIPVGSGFGWWAAPHAWASGLMIQCSLMAHRIHAADRRAAEPAAQPG